MKIFWKIFTIAQWAFIVAVPIYLIKVGRWIDLRNILAIWGAIFLIRYVLILIVRRRKLKRKFFKVKVRYYLQENGRWNFLFLSTRNERDARFIEILSESLDTDEETKDNYGRSFKAVDKKGERDHERFPQNSGEYYIYYISKENIIGKIPMRYSIWRNRLILA